MADKRNGPRVGAVGPTDKPSAGFSIESSAVGSVAQLAPRQQRVAVYVDGFNLYHGMHERFGRRFLWLDLAALGRRLLLSDQKLVAVKYFTARMRGGGESASRQGVYLGALRSTGVNVVEGRFQEKHQECRRCGARWRSYEEKESDVSLSVGLLEDAVGGLFDTALLITGDSDMCPAVRAVQRQRPQARVIAVFPPGRVSGELGRTATASFNLGATALRQSQLAETVQSESTEYKRPSYWA